MTMIWYSDMKQLHSSHIFCLLGHIVIFFFSHDPRETADRWDFFVSNWEAKEM